MVELLSDLATRAMDSVTQGNIAALAALVFVSALTEIGVPFPFVLDSVLFFSGYQTSPLSLEVVRIMIALLLGREAGSAVIYWSARFLGRSFLNWSERRLPVLRSRMEWLTAKLSHHAPLAVAIARLTPGLLTASSVASGFMCLRYYYFVLGIALSSVIADCAFIILGLLTGHAIRYFDFTPSFWHVILALVIIVVLFWVLRRVLGRSR